MNRIRVQRPHITIPGCQQAIILTEVEDLAIGEFALGDPFHGHRVADVQCSAKVGPWCLVECQCGQCGRYPTVPVTTVTGEPVGTSGPQGCIYCGYHLFVLDARKGIISCANSRKQVQITVSIPDAVQRWQEYQQYLFHQARQAADVTKAVRAAPRQHRHFG